MFEGMYDFDEIKRKATALGVEEWIETLESWGGSLSNGADTTPAGWYLTDLRHISNLASPRMQGFVTDDTPPDREEALVLLGDEIWTFIDDLFAEDDEDSDDN